MEKIYKVKPDQLSARDFPEVYKQLNIDLSELGCVMLDLHPPKVLEEIRRETPGLEPLLHHYTDPKFFWMKGWVASVNPHVSLRYGLLDDATAWKDLIGMVLEGWSIEDVEVDKVEFFESQAPSEDCWCIVARIKNTPNLMEGHERLGMLPNVATFTKYKQHFTICYLKRVAGEEYRDTLIGRLNSALAGKKIEVKPGLNYGGKPK